MNIYEVLERMIVGPRFRDDEQEAAVKLIRDMRDLNVFGTMARVLDPASHECRAGEWWPDSGRCLTCQEPMTIPGHICSPSISSGNGFGGYQWSRRAICRICGKEM